jgi:hypothetical protein
VRRDVKFFKTHVVKNPGQAGRLSHCLGLSDELAEIETGRTEREKRIEKEEEEQ